MSTHVTSCVVYVHKYCDSSRDKALLNFAFTTRVMHYLTIVQFKII